MRRRRLKDEPRRVQIRVSRRRFLKQSSKAVLSASTLSLGLKSQIFGESRLEFPDKDLLADLSEFIPRLMNKHGVPGLAIAVIKDAQILWSRGFGIKSVLTKESVSEDTVFEAASLSKPAFAYAVLKLCEQGKIALDTPLVEHLDKSLITNDPRLKLITLRMILSHTSGLPHGRPPGTPIMLRFTPGDHFAYSATGFQYAQNAIQNLVNQPLAEFMKSRLLEPFGMGESNFGWREQYEKQAAKGHDKDGNLGLSGNGKYLQSTLEEKAQSERDFPEWKYPTASAGLYTTASDYAKFMIQIIQPSKDDRFRLSETMTSEMLKPQMRITDAIFWGLGWGIERTDVGDAFWHWGDWGVFRNFAIAVRHQRSGVVILTNSFNGPKVYREIVPRAIGGNHPAFAWVNAYRP